MLEKVTDRQVVVAGLTFMKDECASRSIRGLTTLMAVAKHCKNDQAVMELALATLSDGHILDDDHTRIWTVLEESGFRSILLEVMQRFPTNKPLQELASLMIVLIGQVLLNDNNEEDQKDDELFVWVDSTTSIVIANMQTCLPESCYALSMLIRIAKHVFKDAAEIVLQLINSSDDDQLELTMSTLVPLINDIARYDHSAGHALFQGHIFKKIMSRATQDIDDTVLIHDTCYAARALIHSNYFYPVDTPSDIQDVCQMIHTLWIQEGSTDVYMCIPIIDVVISLVEYDDNTLGPQLVAKGVMEFITDVMKSNMGHNVILQKASRVISLLMSHCYTKYESAEEWIRLVIDTMNTLSERHYVPDSAISAITNIWIEFKH